MTKLDINIPLTHAVGLDVNGNEVVVKLITPLYTHPVVKESLTVQKPLTISQINNLFDDMPLEVTGLI